jgi:hypothetical protein
VGDQKKCGDDRRGFGGCLSLVSGSGCWCRAFIIVSPESCVCWCGEEGLLLEKGGQLLFDAC